MKKILTVLIIAFVAAACNNNPQSIDTAERDSNYSRLSNEEKRLPANALAGIDVTDGLVANLFASEPMIGNPTNIDVDARGRVWMCEAFNYRPSLNPEHPTHQQGDRILILEDKDGDGKADTAKVFYQGPDVNAALGIAVLGNKVIVSCSPNVFVFTDDNGDDIPDRKEVLFTHVGGVQHDHAIHAFTFGPDGKLYFNFGNEGEQLMDKNGKLISDKEGKPITNKGEPFRQGMVFRMNVDGSEVEVLGHNFRNNYEAAVDAYGTIWQSDNDDDGNQSTRVNYVMEYGNYGYTDEMTGAGWRARRTNMETEIPKRHWHQSDPGTVPNLLVTGAGSPAGLCFYEGKLLPQQFRNQMIHAEPGNNIVRSYPVTKEGAGYAAQIQPLMVGKRDQWFRPIDVCAAPDGSLLVADWYDPGVGGHQMGDMNRGRIYRLSVPGKENYSVAKTDLNTAEGAADALTNANGATRYLAWQKLHALGNAAEPALLKLWKGDDAVNRARSLWLLARISGKEKEYLKQAVTDDNADIRITGLRAARQIEQDVIPYVEMLVNDKDVQVLRECAIALRHNTSPKAAALWVDLALKYDGNDKWYLEALGIGADEQWDRFLSAYANKAADNLNNESARNIYWRSRSAVALPTLAKYIQDNSTSSGDRLRYFRAFDFIKSPQKQTVLLALLDNQGANRGDILLNTLNTLSAEQVASNAKVKAALNETLNAQKGTQNFVDLVRRYKQTNRNEELLQMALNYSDSSLGNEAAGLLVSNGGADLLNQVIKGADTLKAAAALKTLGRAGTREAAAMMQRVIFDGSIPLKLREGAVRTLASGWSESERLLGMMKQSNFPKQLLPVASSALSTTYRKDIRNEALKFGNVNNASGEALPPINALARLTGDPENGKQLFTQVCSTCHQVGALGSNFGPALTTIGSKLTKDALYLAIIHPDAGISFGYEGHVFTLNDGNVVAGIIISETAEAVELSMPGGLKKKFARSQIASRKKMDNSMMPATLYQTMKQQQLVNLVEYLYGLKDDRSTANK